MFNLNKLFQRKHEDAIKCTIRTPQFKDGMVHEWKVQEGSINTETLLFTPKDSKYGHSVQFHSWDDFYKFKV